MASFYLRINGNTKRSKLFGYVLEDSGKLGRRTLDLASPIKTVQLPSIVDGDYLILLYTDGTYSKFLCTGEVAK